MKQNVNLISVMKELEQASLQRNQNVKVIDVRYLGESKLGEKTRNVFLVIEEQELTDGNKKIIEKYFDQDQKFLAANIVGDNLGLGINEEFVKDEKLDGTESTLIKELGELDKNGKASLEDVKKIAKKLGVKEENVMEKAEIDPKAKMHTTKDDVNVKQEVKTNEKVTDEYTMEQVLNVQDKDYAKIMIVYTDDLENPGNNTRFTLVGETRTGELEVIDTVEQRYGINPDKDIQAVNSDGTKVETKDARSIFHIKGKEEEEIAINYGETGTIDVSYLRTPRTENREGFSIPIETHNTRYTTEDVRTLGNIHKNTRVDDDVKIAKEDRDNEMNDNQAKELITDRNNNNDKFIETAVDNMVRENDKIYETYNRKELEEELKERLKQNPDRDPADIIAEMTEEKIREAEEQEQQKTLWNKQ